MAESPSSRKLREKHTGFAPEDHRKAAEWAHDRAHASFLVAQAVKRRDLVHRHAMTQQQPWQLTLNLLPPSSPWVRSSIHMVVWTTTNAGNLSSSSNSTEL